MCKIEECNEKHYAKGYCRRHYRHITEGNGRPLSISHMCEKCNVHLTARARRHPLCRSCYFNNWKLQNKEKQDCYHKEYRLKNKK
jgi:hypothetical protein